IERAEAEPAQADIPVSKLWEERRQVETELRQLAAQLEKQFPRYAGLKYPRPCTLDEARACLAPNEVALEFVLGKDESYVLLLEPKPAPNDKTKGLAIYRLPGQEVIEDQVSTLVDSDTLALLARVRSQGAELYNQLLGPLADRLRGKDLLL